jgi:hypothetical protein
MPDLPLGLRHALESGQCVLFLGAGIGAHLLEANGNPAPDGSTLAREMAAHFGIDDDGTSDLSKISEFVEITKGRLEAETFVRKRLGGLEPDEHFQMAGICQVEGHLYDELRRGHRALLRAYSKPASASDLGDSHVRPRSSRPPFRCLGVSLTWCPFWLTEAPPRFNPRRLREVPRRPANAFRVIENGFCHLHAALRRLLQPRS